MKIKKIIFIFTCLFVVFLCYIERPVEYKIKHDVISTTLLSENKNEEKIEKKEGLVELIPNNSYLYIKPENIIENESNDEDVISKEINFEEEITEDIEDENVTNENEDFNFEEITIKEETETSDETLTKKEEIIENLENNENIENELNENTEDNNIEPENNENELENTNKMINEEEDIITGKYIIRRNSDNFIYTIESNSIENGTEVILSEEKILKNQLWNIEIVDNYYKISSIKNPNVVWTYDNNKIILQKWDNLSNQKWNILKEEEIKFSVEKNVLEDTFILDEYKEDIIYNGIDISYYQDNIEWDKISNSDVDFVIIRGGYGDNFFIQDDQKFIDNVIGCETYNIPYGIYLYSYAINKDGDDNLNINSQSTMSEIAHIMRLLDKLKDLGYTPNINTQVFYDIEDDLIGLLDKNTITNMADTFCSNLNKNDLTCGIYANKYWLNNNLDNNYLSNKYPIWLAEWLNGEISYEEAKNLKPSYDSSNYKYWQFSSIGKIDGIIGDVDLDFGYNIFES